MSRRKADSEQVSAQLDLHGYRLQEAIRRLTYFLEDVVKSNDKRGRQDRDVWVLVVTGSGSHSPNGPVLRDAVEALLKKRQMVYKMNRGRGGLIVLANSGHVLYAPGPAMCTKVIVQEQQPNSTPIRPTPINQATLATINPLPAEVAAHYQSIRASRDEFGKMKNQEKKEKRVLEKAVSMSSLEYERIEQQRQHDDEILQRALSMSCVEDHHSRMVDDVELIEEAIQLSKQDIGTYLYTSTSTTSGIENTEADDELERALEASLRDLDDEDDELIRAIKMSQYDRGGVEQEFEMYQYEPEDESTSLDIATSMNVG